MWSASATDVWLVGVEAAIAYLIHWDGNEPTTVLELPNSMSSNHYLDWALAGSASDDVYAVGLCQYCDDDVCPCLEEPSSVWHFDGQVWTELPSPGARVRHMWAQGGSAYVVGEAMLRWDGVAWDPVPGYPDPSMDGETYDIWGTSDTDIWIGGVEGKLWHFDGVTWTDMSLPEDGPVIAIDGTSATQVWALVEPDILQWDEEPNRIYAFDGSTWTLALQHDEINDIAVLDGGLIGVGSTAEYIGQQVVAIDTEFGVIEELYRREDLGWVEDVHVETITDAVAVIRPFSLPDEDLALLRLVDGKWQFESLDDPTPEHVIKLIAVPGEAPYALADVNEPTILWRFEDPVFVPLEAPVERFNTVGGARVGDEIWAAGNSNQAIGPWVARFDGTQWFDVPFEDPDISDVTGLTAADGRVFVTVIRSGDLPEQLLRREGDAWVPLTDDLVHDFQFEYNPVHASAADRVWLSVEEPSDVGKMWGLFTWDGDEFASMSDVWPELAGWESALIGGASSSNVWLARVTDWQPIGIAYWNGEAMNLLDGVPAEFEASSHGSVHPSEDGLGVLVYSTSPRMLWHCGP